MTDSYFRLGSWHIVDPERPTPSFNTLLKVTSYCGRQGWEANVAAEPDQGKTCESCFRNRERRRLRRQGAM